MDFCSSTVFIGVPDSDCLLGCAHTQLLTGVFMNISRVFKSCFQRLLRTVCIKMWHESNKDSDILSIALCWELQYILPSTDSSNSLWYRNG